MSSSHLSAVFNKLIVNRNVLSKDVIRSLGLVFGDIGTSPIYTLTVIFSIIKPTQENLIGVVSLIVWTLITLVSLQYAYLAMGLSRKGEGGTIVLKEILVSLLKSKKAIGFVTFLSFIGISLLMGDGVITPAISILSAVEGLLLVPGFSNVSQDILVLIASIIAILLFLFQKKGTGNVSIIFGPIMALWFSLLAISGVEAILHEPSILKAVIPYYAVRFLMDHGLTGFFILSEVILCATGGEALYADMGHLGREPIVEAWKIVFVALCLNYLGQGAFLMEHPETKNILFGMFYHQISSLYVPFLIISIMATVIASQAMISGMFSIVYQGITTRIMPLLKVDYTSTKLSSQIYIGSINWFLLFFVLFIMYDFKESNRLAAAYGLAVTGTMTLTGIMMTCIFYLRNNILKASISMFITLIDLIFLVSNLYKIPHGGYWSIIIAFFPFVAILIYTSGQKRLYQVLNPIDKKIFIEKYEELYKNTTKIKGTSLFFARVTDKVSPYIVNTMFTNNIIYEDNIIVSITKLDSPFGVKFSFKDNLSEGLRVFNIEHGYMEFVDIEALLRKVGIDEKVIFYGVEDIVTSNIVWKIFSIMKKLSPTFVQFYRLPPDKLHGVITRVYM